MESNNLNINEINKIEEKTIQRVFHIDKECYIIYTGSSPDDLKPFLRIGNKPHLDEQVISNIGNIIVSDWYTGNPTYEQYNIDQKKIQQNCYVGDSKTVNRLLDFLSSRGIHTEGVQKKVSIKDKEKTAYIYFYKDGNIKAYYKKNLLFDLKEREKKDKHFLQSSAELKEKMLSSPFRVHKDVLSKQGFIITERNLFLFSQSRLLACGLKNNFYKELVLSGIDPDLISTLITEKADDGLFNLLKRKKFTSNEINIITDSPDVINSACRMFTFQGEAPLKYTVSTVNSKKILKAGGFSVKIDRDKKKILVNMEGFPNTFAYGKENSRNGNKEEAGTIFIQPDLNIFTVYLKEKSFKNKAYKNCCYIVHSDLPSLKDLLENYLADPIRDLDAIAGRYTSHLNKQIVLFSKEIMMGLSVPQSSKRIKKLLKKVKKTDYYIENLAILNTGEIIRLLVEDESLKKRFTPVGTKVLKQLLGKIESYYKKLKGIPEIPLYGNIYIANDRTYIFYNYPSVTGFKDGVKDYLQLKEEIKKEELEDEKNYRKDYKELINFITSLNKTALVEKEAPSEKPTEIKPGEIEKRKAPKTLGTPVSSPEITGLKPKRKGIKPFFKKSFKEKIPEIKITTKETLKEEPLKKVRQKLERETIEERTIQRVKKEKTSEIETKKKTFIITGIITVIVLVIIALFAIYNPGNVLKRTSKRISLEEKATKLSKAEELTSTGEKAKSFIFHKAEEPKSHEEKITEIVKNEISEERKSKTQIPEEHYILITIKDIFLLTNKIARDNGYKELNNPDNIGKDPNWIYPGNIFKLPDGSNYEVVKGDTLWYISYKYIRKQVDNDYLKTMEIIDKIDQNKKNKIYIQNAIEELIKIKHSSYSENFKKFIDENLEKIYRMI